MVVDIGVPVLVVTSMFVVGTELTANDFRRVARQPGIIVVATFGQFVLLPLIAWALRSCLTLRPETAQGLLLVAACPSGSMANVHSYIAKANVAMCVTLTAMSCLAALLLTPLALAISSTGSEDAIRLAVPTGVLARQLGVLLILPVLGGMLLRHWRPDITQRHGRTLLGVGVTALALLLLAIIASQFRQFISTLPEIAASASLFTVFALMVGFGTGWVFRANAVDCFALAMVFVVRNVGVATALAVTALGRIEFAVFATTYFLIQVPIVLCFVFLFRRVRVADSNDITKVEP